MAEKEFVAKITADTSQVDGALNKTADALNNVAQAEENVADSANKMGTALKNAGNETDSIERAENSIKSLQGATELVAGSIAAGVGSLALFGAETEKLGEIERKVQGSIAIALGVREAAEGALLLVQQKKFIQEKAVQAATKISTAVQAAYNAVLAANPIALIVLAVAGFIIALVALKDKIKIVSDAFDFVNQKFQQFLGFLGLGVSEEEKAAAASKKLAGEKEQQYTRELNLLKAKGATEEEIYKKSRQIAEQQLAQVEKGTEEYKNALNQISIIDAEFAAKQEEERQKRQEEQAKEAQKRREDLKKRAKELALDAELIGKTEEEQAKIIAKRTFDERIAGFKEGSVAYKNALALYNDELKQIEFNAGKEARDKKKKDDEDAIQKEKEKQQSLLDLVAQFDTAEEDYNATTDLERLALEEQRTLAELERLGATEQQKNDILAFYAQQRKDAKDKDDKETLEADQAIARARLSAQLDFVMAVGDVISGLGAFAKEGTKAAKAAALAEIAISTGVGFAKGLQIAQQSATATGPGAALAFPIFYATQIAAVLAAVGKAKQIIATVPGGGSGASTSAPTIPTASGGGSSSPSAGFFTPGFASTGGTTGGATGTLQGGMVAPVRSYVLAGDVTSAQAAEAKLQQRRTL